MITFDAEIQINVVHNGCYVRGAVDILFREIDGGYIFAEIQDKGLTIRGSRGKLYPVTPEIMSYLSRDIEDILVDGQLDDILAAAVERYRTNADKARNQA